MSSSTPSTSHPYTFDEFLLLCLSTFDAAVKACRRRSVTSFTQNPHFEHVWNVNYSETVDSFGELPVGTSEEMEKAFKKWNLCDHFCLFLYRFLKDYAEKFGYTVKWVNVLARPKYVLLPGNMEQAEVRNHLQDLRHSVLTIRTNTGRSIAFDGTPEQFGWEESSSIMDLGSFWDERVVGDTFFDDGTAEENDPMDIRRVYDEYWADVFEELLELLNTMNWDDMVRLEPAERKELLRIASESRAFAVASKHWV